jgi:hypothetical protein
MNSGKLWVIGLLALGGVAGGVAVTYWKRPQNSVRWSFTQIHTSLVRGRKEAAVRFLAPRVLWQGRDCSAPEFIAAYGLPPQADTIQVASCAATAPHWTVAMTDQVYCFFEEGPLWKLHWVGPGPCSCR